jgi:hypothetical protein
LFRYYIAISSITYIAFFQTAFKHFISNRIRVSCFALTPSDNSKFRRLIENSVAPGDFHDVYEQFQHFTPPKQCAGPKRVLFFLLLCRHREQVRAERCRGCDVNQQPPSSRARSFLHPLPFAIVRVCFVISLGLFVVCFLLVEQF